MRPIPRRLATTSVAPFSRLAVASAVWCSLAVAAIGQQSAGPSDEELLLSYRRDGAADAAGPNGNAPPASDASTPSSVENSLRPTNEPTPTYRFPDARPTPPSADSTPGVPVGASPAIGVENVTLPGIGPAPQQPTPTAPPLHYDGALQQLAHNEAAKPSESEPKEAPLAPAPLPGEALPLTTDYPPASNDSRHLAPRSTSSTAAAASSAESGGEGLKSRLPISFSKLESLSTAGAGLAIVVGLFFVCMWLLRRSSGAKGSGILPNEAFAVLGRAPLTPQSFAHLLRVGNKLVLVAISSDGIQPLTEVVDPIEVDRLTGVCASGRGHGPAAEFQQVLAQLAREPARGFLGGEAANGGGRRRA